METIPPRYPHTMADYANRDAGKNGYPSPSGFSVITVSPESESMPGCKYQCAVNGRLEFEQLLSDLATRFVNLPAARIDGEIENILRTLSEFFQVDRGTIFQLSPPHTLDPIHTYASEGVDPVAGVDAGKQYPWCWQNLLGGKIIVIASLESLPVEASIDRENMKRIGVRTFVGIPVRIKGDFRYVFTLTGLRRSRNWDPSRISRIQLVGQLLGNALHRKETEIDLMHLSTEIHQFRNELSHRERVGTIGALTTAIAHEINQPLAAILSNAQAALRIMAKDPPDLVEVRQILEDIVSDDKRASDVIYNIRSLLKKKEIQNDRFDLNGLVSKVTRMVGTEAILRKITLVEALAPDLPTVSGDRIQIQQVIMNLLINAMDAVRGVGDGAPVITIGTRMEDGWIDIHVRDTGPGITETSQNTLFKPFYSTKKDGLGIGLTICRSIIEAHGGILSAQNQPGGGARFSFRLPAAVS